MPPHPDPLQALLDPVPTRAFLDATWGRASLYVAGSPAKAQALEAGSLEPGPSALDGLVRSLCEQVARPGRAGGEFLLSSDEEGSWWQQVGRHTFVVQLEGSKCWQFGVQPGGAPPVGAGLREELLAAGDVLYLPPGCWWRTFPLERSCALTVSLDPTGGTALPC